MPHLRQAAFIGRMCFEMSKTAREAKLDVLVYLLELASLEAANQEVGMSEKCLPKME